MFRGGLIRVDVLPDGIDLAFLHPVGAVEIALDIVSAKDMLDISETALTAQIFLRTTDDERGGRSPNMIDAVNGPLPLDMKVSARDHFDGMVSKRTEQLCTRFRRDGPITAWSLRDMINT